MNNIRKAGLALALLASAFAAPVQAADREIRTLTVDYSDLNLASPSGVATLRHRLAIASRNVCGESDGHELAVRADMLACRDAALGKATRDLSRVIANASTRHGAVVAVASK